MSAQKFHEKVNNNGPTISVVKTKTGICGGYINTSLKSRNQWLLAHKSFLFS